jgi:hypothetical protein
MLLHFDILSKITHGADRPTCPKQAAKPFPTKPALACSSPRKTVLGLAHPSVQCKACAGGLGCLEITFFFFFSWYWGLNYGPIPWATPPALFCEGFFEDRVSGTICPKWSQTLILLISASWVTRIIGMSHWRLASDDSIRFCPEVTQPDRLQIRTVSH